MASWTFFVWTFGMKSIFRRRFPFPWPSTRTSDKKIQIFWIFLVVTQSADTELEIFSVFLDIWKKFHTKTSNFGFDSILKLLGNVKLNNLGILKALRALQSLFLAVPFHFPQFLTPSSLARTKKSFPGTQSSSQPAPRQHKINFLLGAAQKIPKKNQERPPNAGANCSTASRFPRTTHTCKRASWDFLFRLFGNFLVSTTQRPRKFLENRRKFVFGFGGAERWSISDPLCITDSRLDGACARMRHAHHIKQPFLSRSASCFAFWTFCFVFLAFVTEHSVEQQQRRSAFVNFPSISRLRSKKKFEKIWKIL